MDFFQITINYKLWVHRLRVFDLPEDSMERAALGSGAVLDSLRGLPDNIEPVIQAREAETIYDFAWFSAMRTDDPASCCFASTSRVRLPPKVASRSIQVYLCLTEA